MGFFLLMAAGNDSTKATYCSGMRAIMEDPEQRALLLEDPSLVPDAVEESLRMFPAFAHFRRTATHDTELHGQPIKEGEKVVMWYVSSNRDETRYEDPDRFDLRRKAEHQAFGAGGRHFCLGTALARLELRILIEETLERYPRIAIDGDARVRRIALHQPAEDPAGEAPGLSRESPARGPELQTERLLLRRWRPADLEPFAAINADPEVMEYFPATYSRAETALRDRPPGGRLRARRLRVLGGRAAGRWRARGIRRALGGARGHSLRARRRDRLAASPASTGARGSPARRPRLRFDFGFETSACQRSSPTRPPATAARGG